MTEEETERSIKALAATYEASILLKAAVRRLQTQSLGTLAYSWREGDDQAIAVVSVAPIDHETADALSFIGLNITAIAEIVAARMAEVKSDAEGDSDAFGVSVGPALRDLADSRELFDTEEGG